MKRLLLFVTLTAGSRTYLRSLTIPTGRSKNPAHAKSGSTSFEAVGPPVGSLHGRPDLVAQSLL